MTPETPEPKTVGDDEHRRHAHGAGRDHRVEHAERRERDRGGVVGERVGLVRGVGQEGVVDLAWNSSDWMLKSGEI